MDADVIVVGAGLAGLVATAELADAGRKVLLLDQEPEQSLGGQAFWSFGGLFLVDSPEQRRMGIKDSRRPGLAGLAGQRRVRPARGPLAAAVGRGLRRLRRRREAGLAARDGPAAVPGGRLGRARRRRGRRARQLGAAVPHHLGHRPRRGRAVRAAGARRPPTRAWSRSVSGTASTALVTTGGVVTGVRGARPGAQRRAGAGQSSSRTETADFAYAAQAVIVTSGGIGGDHDLVRKAWPARLGTPPKRMVTGVPAHVDGRMLGITEAAGGQIINPDRMWHYTEGLRNWDPIWPGHGIRILPGPSSLWLDATGRRLPAPLFPGFDTLGTLKHLMATGYDYSWFVLTQKIIEKEFALSGSEQNPDLTNRSVRQVLGRVRPGATPPVEAFKKHGADFVVAADPGRTGRGHEQAGRRRAAARPSTSTTVRRIIEARDREIANPFSKDAQVTAIQGARRYRGDKLIRVATPHRLLDPAAGPLIAVRLQHPHPQDPRRPAHRPRQPASCAPTARRCPASTRPAR